MKLERIRLTEALAGIAGVVLLGSLSLVWFDISSRGEVTAWGAFGFTAFILAVLAGTAIAMPFISATNAKTDVPITMTSLTVLLGVLGTLLIVYRLFSPIDDGTQGVGLYVGLFACLGVLIASWRAMADERAHQPS